MNVNLDKLLLIDGIVTRNRLNKWPLLRGAVGSL